MGNSISLPWPTPSHARPDQTTIPLASHASVLTQPCVDEASSIAVIARKVFTYCATGEDLKTLLAVRSVCKAWKIGVIEILHENSNLFPTLCEGSFENVSYSETGHRYRSLDTFLRNVSPTAGFPVQVRLGTWSQEVVQFVRDFSQDIISLSININYCKGFSLGHGATFNLPKLRDVTLEFRDSKPRQDSFKVKNAFTLLEEVIRESNVLETCQVSLYCQPNTMDHYDIALFPLPKQTTRFSCSDSVFFERITQAKDFPKMDKVGIVLPSPGNHSSCFVDANFDKLKELYVSGYYQPPATTLKLPEPLERLRFLDLYNVSISGTQMFSVLLPNLSSLKITEPQTPYILTSLCGRGEEFQNLVELELHQCVNIPLEDFQNQVNLRVATLKTGFPNLTKFTWFLASTEVATLAASQLFSSLEQLKSLMLHVDFVEHEDDIVQLLTGLSKTQIPWFSSNWPTAIIGRQDSITNLQRLEKFRLSLEYVLQDDLEDENFQLPSRESGFLFTAAFTKMTSLTELQFDGCVIQNEEVKQQWRNSGRTLVENLD